MFPNFPSILAVFGALALTVQAADFHVSPQGSDTASGTADAPFKTLSRAAKALRGLGKKEASTVWLSEGTYPVDKTLEFNAEDSGTADAPITFRAKTDGSVVFDASKHLTALQFVAVNDAATLARLPEVARGKVYQLDLAKAGVQQVKPFPDSFSDGGGLFDLYLNGERLPLARWPNAGNTTLAKVLQKGSATKGKDATPSAFQYREKRIARWSKAAEDGQLWLAGFWRVPWSFETIRVQKLDPSSQSITLAAAASGGMGSKYAGPEGAGTEPYHAINLLEELDQPGEWCINFKTQILYLWPTLPLNKAHVVISNLVVPLLKTSGASHLTFRGLVFQSGLGDGISINDGSHVTIAACTVRQMGKNGVVVAGGTNHSVLSCDLHSLGWGGLVMGGGDRKTLAPAHHLADNNHIWHFGLVKKVYAPGIALGALTARPAVGCTVTHNRIHDCPHGGVQYGGNDNLFEYNEVYDVVKESDDMGAFYSTHDWSSYGNQVNHNFIHHSPHATGLYADDGDSGDHWEGNLFYRTICGPFIGGGHDNVAINNVAVSCGRGAHIDQRGLARGYGTEALLFKQLTDMDVQNPPWSERYPSLKTLATDTPAMPRGDIIERTVAVDCESVLHTSGKEAELRRCRIENNVELSASDLGFADLSRLDFRMKPDAPVFKKVPGFQAIPFEKIGLQVNELRPHLPEREAAFSRGTQPIANTKGGSFASMLAVTSPTFMQVFQRFNRTEGAIKVSGTVGEAVNEVRYRVTGQPLEGELPDEWRSIPVDGTTHTFDSSVNLPAGGWYRMEIKAYGDGQALTQWNVDQFGVGEVFIVAGQSNAANHGSEKLVTETRLVAEFDGKQWNLANDPQKGASGNGGSFMPAFGDAMARRFGVPIGLVPVASGGTSVREWLPKGIAFKELTTTGKGVVKKGDHYEADGNLFLKLTQPMKTLGVGGFRAVLWHQGESDVGQAREGTAADRQITGQQYTEFMEHLIRRSRNAATWPVPWFTAITTYHRETDAHDDEFRAAMQALWHKGLSWPGPDTDTLTGDLRAGVHFNAKGLRKHGEMWAEKVGSWLESTIAPPREGPPSSDYKMVWHDEFDGPKLDESKWSHRYVGKRRSGWIDPECVTFDGQGHMLISVKKVGDEYHGGMIGTEKKKSWTYGYFECRVKVATELGMNTAFWMQAPRMGIPDQGKGVADDTAHNGTELDILEYIARQGEVAHFNLHWNGYGKLHKSAPADSLLHGLREGFHVYGMEWSPEGYSFYLDGRPVWHTTEAISKTDEYIILDLEVSDWAGGIDQATLPASAVFDWVRVWQK